MAAGSWPQTLVVTGAGDAAFLQPSNRIENLGDGCACKPVEYGLAIAWGKDVFIVGGRENIFHHLEGVRLFGTFEELVESL